MKLFGNGNYTFVLFLRPFLLSIEIKYILLFIVAAILLIWATLVTAVVIVVLATFVSASEITVSSLVLGTISLVHLASTHLSLNIFFHQINDFIRNTQILDRASSNIAFAHSPETVTILKNKLFLYLSDEMRRKVSELTFDVQMTSRRFIFIHVSQLTRCPL